MIPIGLRIQNLSEFGNRVNSIFWIRPFYKSSLVTPVKSCYYLIIAGIFLTVYRLLIASINFVFVSFGVFGAQFWIFELSFTKKIA